MRNVSLVLLLVFLSACSTTPMIPVAPAVSVSQFEPMVITPEGISFQARVVIKNQMRGNLNIDKVDWGASLHDNPVIDKNYAGLKRMRSRQQQTVTFPFQIAMGDIVDQAVDVLAEESVRVEFRGSVHPVGFEPISFEATRTIPVPKIPTVSIEGVKGNPLKGAFTVTLGIKNTNDFPITLQSVNSNLSLNGKKYHLLCSEKNTHMPPGAMGKVALMMKQTRGKSLSMALNVFKSKGSTDFEVGGTLSCKTPHGVIKIPLSLSSK